MAGSLWLGAGHQRGGDPFQGRAEQNLLLHFWPLTAQIFVPQQIDSDGKGEFVGFVLAIPEVNDLKNFIVDYPLMLSELGKDVRGFRPAEAVIDLPAQGALAFLEHLAAAGVPEGGRCDPVFRRLRRVPAPGEVRQQHQIDGGGADCAAAELLEQYQAIVGRPGQPPRYRNPLFRRGLMLALLDDREWYEPMGSILADWPAPFFVVGEGTPRNLPWFFMDARQKFQDEYEDHQSHLEVTENMTSADPPAPRPRRKRR